jgi:hypothetical protein
LRLSRRLGLYNIVYVVLNAAGKYTASILRVQIHLYT